jgi:hypothetical protein
VDALRACPPDVWIAVDDFFRFMIASHYRFEVTREPWDLYISDAEYGSLGYDGFHDWNILQGRYVLAFLFEYVALLGLIDVAYIDPNRARRDFSNLWGVDDLTFLSRYDGLRYLRINTLGAWILGLRDRYTPSEPEKREIFKVLPTMDVVAVDVLQPGDRLFLDQIGKQTSDMVWRLQRERILEACERGYAVSEIITGVVLFSEACATRL